MEKYKELISTYKDFPKNGIEFKDVLGIIQEPEIFKKLILEMSSSQIIKNAEAIISIDARGFIFGSAISLLASKPMLVARKPGKLPGEILKKSYNLEYGQNSLCIQKKSLQNELRYEHLTNRFTDKEVDGQLKEMSKMTVKQLRVLADHGFATSSETPSFEYKKKEGENGEMVKALTKMEIYFGL